MQFIQIKYFQALVDFGSMNLAAEKLFVSQSAISQSIRKLEDEFGVSFFERRPGGTMQLTDDGKTMLHFVQKFTKLDEEMHMAFTKKNHVSIVLYSSGGYLFAPLIRNYSETHPYINFKTHVASRSETIAALLEGKADIIIDGGYIDEPKKMEHIDLVKYMTNPDVIERFCKKYSLQWHFLYSARLYLCVPSDSIYAAYNEISFRQLSSIPIIRCHDMADFDRWITAVEEYLDIPLNTLMNVDAVTYNSLIFEYKYNTIVLGTFILSDERYRTQRRMIPIEDSIVSRDFYIYAHKERPVVNDFLKSALSEFDWNDWLVKNCP